MVLYRADRMALRLCSLAACALAAGVLAAGAPPPKDTDASTPASNSRDGMWGKNRSDWQVAIYPIFAWAPLFGGHVDVPNTGSTQPDGPTLPGSVLVQASNWPKLTSTVSRFGSRRPPQRSRLRAR